MRAFAHWAPASRVSVCGSVQSGAMLQGANTTEQRAALNGSRRPLRRTSAAWLLGACVLACRAPARAQLEVSSSAPPPAAGSAMAPAARSVGVVVSASAAPAQLPPPAKPTADPASRVTQADFPACGPGLSRISRHAEYDRRESLSCARIRGKQITRHGPSWSWFEAESLSKVDNYADGLKQGRSIRWYRSGVQRQEGEFVHGARVGIWRTFHRSGALAEEAHYDHGALHGPRHRFFESGRPSLDANYNHGLATGSWRAFYDREPPNLALTAAVVHGKELQEFAAFTPDGAPWPSNRKLANCSVGTECSAPLALLDLNALPGVFPEPCPMGGASGRARSVPANQFSPIIVAARKAWDRPGAEIPSLAPAGCVEAIRLSCAPDLDGAPGAELLAEIQYYIYRTGCSSPEPNGLSWSPSLAIVALSPAKAGSGWKEHGLLGYRAFSAAGIEGGASMGIAGFYRLPSGETAVRARESLDAGDCGGGVFDHLLLPANDDWRVVAARTVDECNQGKEPEETDDF